METDQVKLLGLLAKKIKSEKKEKSKDCCFIAICKNLNKKRKVLPAIIVI